MAGSFASRQPRCCERRGPTASYVYVVCPFKRRLMRNVNTSWRVGVGVCLYIEVKGKQELLFDYMHRCPSAAQDDNVGASPRVASTKFKYMQYTHTDGSHNTPAYLAMHARARRRRHHATKVLHALHRGVLLQWTAEQVLDSGAPVDRRSNQPGVSRQFDRWQKTHSKGKRSRRDQW